MSDETRPAPDWVGDVALGVRPAEPTAEPGTDATSAAPAVDDAGAAKPPAAGPAAKTTKSKAAAAKS